MPSQRQTFDLFANCIELERVVSLPWLLETVCSIYIAAVVLGKPAVPAGQCVELVYQVFVVIAGEGTRKVTVDKYLGPHGDVVCDYPIAGARKCLRYARRSGKSIENRSWFYFLSELKDVRQELQF